MSISFDLSGKVVLVTGASSGIGRQIAITLNSAGAYVIMISRNNERLLQTQQMLSHPEQSRIIPFDLIQIEEFKTIVGELPVLDGVVFSAGIMHTLPFKFINATALSNIMKVNFESPTLFIQQLIKQQKIKQKGSVVYISSIAGNLKANIGNGMYSASKAAIQATVRVLALELAPKKIRVNSIAPGMVKTEMWKKENSSITEEQLLEDEKKYPLGYGAPEDISGIAQFLISDASRWVTGTMIVADGGHTL